MRAEDPILSRLDSFIRRLEAQRACLNATPAWIEGLAGPILELGLGNGRTYDHLRRLHPEPGDLRLRATARGASRLPPRRRPPGAGRHPIHSARRPRPAPGPCGPGAQRPRHRRCHGQRRARSLDRRRAAAPDQARARWSSPISRSTIPCWQPRRCRRRFPRVAISYTVVWVDPLGARMRRAARLIAGDRGGWRGKDGLR